jgi:predicted Na+-dependent transporter
MTAGWRVPGAGSARRMIASYPELTAVLAAAAIGLTVQRPLAWLAARHAISILLAILVFATAITIDPAALRRLAPAWPSLLLVIAAGITVLPALSWAVSRFAAAGPLRDGVMTVGLAPCEIASVATTALAGGEAVLAAGMLIGSTVATVAAAGPILSAEHGRAAVHPAGIIGSLALVVALPLAVGLALRARVRLPGSGRVPLRACVRLPGSGRVRASGLGVAGAERAATMTATGAVVALVAVIASEVSLSSRYLPVAAALVVFLAVSSAIGWLLGTRSRPPSATAVLLTVSMRDFAIAAGIATAAFGPPAAAPLGLYGILVLAWGTAVAGLIRRRGRAASSDAASL